MPVVWRADTADEPGVSRLQGQPGSGEAAFEEAGLVLDFLQAVPDDLEQAGVAGGGLVGQHAALERRPDPFSRFAAVQGSLDRQV
jgi:hypothetical protein